MPEPTTEMVALLREIRDLLLPVADAYRDEYERREAEREEQRLKTLKALLSTDKKKKAWKLADGSHTQAEIGKSAGIDSGNTSRFFKSLRELNAVEGERPKRTVEVKIDA
jgi:hypothetical protein